MMCALVKAELTWNCINYRIYATISRGNHGALSKGVVTLHKSSSGTTMSYVKFLK